MMRKLGMFLLVAVLIAAALVMLLPINKIAETQIKQMMAENGLPPIQFALETMSYEHAVFREISLDDHKLSIEKLVVYYSQNQGDFNGRWEMEAITPPPSILAIPMLQGKGSWRYEQGIFALDGTISSKDNQYRLELDLKDKLLVVRNIGLPWEGGHLSSELAQVNLSEKAPIKFTLHVEQVPLVRLLELLAPGKALATGNVSGQLPVLIDGKRFEVASGKLQTTGKGVVRLAPDVIPATNEQMAMLRDVLSNFHYQEFALTLNSGQDEQLSMLLQLRGNNPELYNGREVKMNVNLSGDVLQLLQHSVLPTVSPEQFLKQDQP
ncbi:MAG: YdbH domain-containing protein [Rickettsiales bacterium]|jgi:hypothetical protein|nr:YdbH domain-containing protein [Rickettsiales bacterium]